jgi:hypothetical protein
MEEGKRARDECEPDDCDHFVTSRGAWGKRQVRRMRKSAVNAKL